MYPEKKHYDPIYINPQDSRKYQRDGATVTEYWRSPQTLEWSYYSSRTYASEDDAKNAMHSHWWYAEEKNWD